MEATQEAAALTAPVPIAALPPNLPPRARAVIVGIESYVAPKATGSVPTVDSTTSISDLEGVVDDAFRLAASLQDDLGLAAGDIDLWLSPGGSPPAVAAPGLRVHAFSSEDFEAFLTDTLAADAAGGLLLLFWSGHGVIDDNNRLRLLLPRATTLRPRNVDAEAICTLLVGADLGQFSHQVIVYNACRVAAVAAGIQRLVGPQPMPAQAPDAARPVSQLKVYGCALAASSRQPKDGAPLLRALRAGWAAAGRNPWPDFEQIAVAAAERVASETDADQRPQVIGWSGQTLRAPRPSLQVLLGRLNWANEDFRALALRCLRANDRRERLDDLPGTVRALEDLAQAGGVWPVHEFVARVLAKAGADAPADLRDWFDSHTDGNERTEIAARLQAEAPLHVLQLWVRDDPGQPGGPAEPAGVSAALLDVEGRALVTNWDIHAVRPFERNDTASLLAVLGGWLEDALARVGQPLLLELFLPTGRLAARIDCEKVVAGGDDYALGVEMPTFLRAMDRHKSRKKRDAWLLKAPKILGRYVSAKLLLHWSADPVDGDQIRSEFAEGREDGAVWLGLPEPPAAPAAAGAAGEPCAFDYALDSGVPSILWLRGGPALPTRQQLDIALAQLLKDTVRNLPHTLKGWRELHAPTLRGEPALLLDDPARPPPWSQKFGRDPAR